MAPHEKILIYTDFLEDENHGSIDCQDCHGGNPKDPNWKTAHKGLIKNPSYTNYQNTCGQCHVAEAEHYTKSLHYTLKPYYTIISKRANPDKKIHNTVMKSMDGHCNRCHSSCGQCHISRPSSVEGGLLDGHVFKKTPPMKLVCTACHGSRIGNEYFGKNEGYQPDVHNQKYMACEKCHTGEEMHGDGKDYADRYEVENGPKCTDCHKEIYTEKSDNFQNHLIHKDKASCYVCHSQPYKNCYSCHVARDKNGTKYFKTKPSSMAFKIGLNPKKSEKRPEKFVTLRHVPIDKDLFSFYVKNGLTRINSLPTWKMTTPHNIRRKTEQNAKCNNCHGEKSLFLLKEDVSAEEREANKNVIVPEDSIPEKQ